MSENTNLPELMNRLHRIHRQLNELNFRLQKGAKIIAFQKSTRKKLEDRLSEMKEDHNVFLLDVKEKERRLQAGEDNLKRRREQLNSAKNNKEYQSLKEQIETDEAANGRFADDALEAMTVAEESSDKVSQTEAEIQEIDRKIESLQQEFNENRPTIEKDIADFSEKLAAAEDELPRDFRGIYARLKKNLGGEESLAPVVNDYYCGNCNQQIPTLFLAELCSGKPVICQACGRLLYAPEGYVLR